MLLICYFHYNILFANIVRTNNMPSAGVRPRIFSTLCVLMLVIYSNKSQNNNYSQNSFNCVFDVCFCFHFISFVCYYTSILSNHFHFVNSFFVLFLPKFSTRKGATLLSPHRVKYTPFPLKRRNTFIISH